MLAQFREAAHDQQTLLWRSGMHLFMFQNPSIAMGYEYRVQSGREGRVDVRFWAVSDHPCGIVCESVLIDQRFVGCKIFFRNDFGRREILFQSRALDLSGLLRHRTLGYQDQTMPGGKVLQRLRNLGQKFYGMISDGMSKALDLGLQFWRNRVQAEPFKRIHQR